MKDFLGYLELCTGVYKLVETLGSNTYMSIRFSTFEVGYRRVDEIGRASTLLYIRIGE